MRGGRGGSPQESVVCAAAVGAPSGTLGEGSRRARSYLYLEVRTMEVGCGARVRMFGSGRYFYFWHYERENGRALRREEYVGRVDSEKARQDLLRRMAAYHARAEQEPARGRGRVEAATARGRT